MLKAKKNRGIGEVPANVKTSHHLARRNFIVGAAAALAVLEPINAWSKLATETTRIVPVRPRPDDVSRRPEPHQVPERSGVAANSAQRNKVRRGGAKASSHRSLAFYHAHTRQSLQVTYYAGGRYVPSALRQINSFMRDYRANRVKSIDAKLLDTLFELNARLDLQEPFKILSAYRSPGTNASMRRRRRGVAKNSLHMQGKAVDIRVKGVGAGKLAREARKLKRGGVGYYRRRGYVHLDVGDVRAWRG